MAGLAGILDAVARHGNKWTLDINKECEVAFTEQHRLEGCPETAEFVSVKKNMQYGMHERHQLDVYTPTTASKPLPIAVYFHGGGFTAGDTDISPYLHSNIGKFFALNGYVCILATYGLLPEAHYPDGADDVAACLAWVAAHIGKYNGQTEAIHVIGQSAGGAHLAMALFSGRLNALSGVRSVVLQSVPFAYDLTLERRRKNMLLYYNTDKVEEILSRAAVTLLASGEWKPDGSSKHSHELYVTVGQYDSDEIVDANMAFIDAYREVAGNMPLFEVLTGHNHISYALAIGLKGDCTGPRLLEFLRRSSHDQ